MSLHKDTPDVSQIFILPSAQPHLKVQGVGHYEESNFRNAIATMEGDKISGIGTFNFAWYYCKYGWVPIWCGYRSD
jgi:hypothetical protein